MAKTSDGLVCDGCGRLFEPNLPVAASDGHRDYCGTCRSNREGDYELERQGRRVLASALRAEPRLLDPDVTAPAADAAAAQVETRNEQADEDDGPPPARRRISRERDN